MENVSGDEGKQTCDDECMHVRSCRSMTDFVVNMLLYYTPLVGELSLNYSRTQQQGYAQHPIGSPCSQSLDVQSNRSVDLGSEYNNIIAY